MDRLVAGWRETVDLPEWGIDGIVAKLDTGALSSCMDARDLDVDPDRPGTVRFTFHGPDGPTEHEEEILDWRLVRDSGGHQELRPVIALRIRLGDQIWDDQVTLHDRSAMRHRILIGRRALAGRFRVDPDETFQVAEPQDAAAAGKASAN